MTDKEQIIIDGIILNDVKDLLFTGQRSSITTSTFEKIIDLLEEKTQECELQQKIIDELGSECKRISKNYKEDEERYRKAFEEIEEYFSHTDDPHMLSVDYEITAPTILDIISKAKGEENA